MRFRALIINYEHQKVYSVKANTYKMCLVIISVGSTSDLDISSVQEVFSAFHVSGGCKEVKAWQEIAPSCQCIFI